MLSAALHAWGVHAILHARINYKIYKLKDQATAVVLVPQDTVPYPQAPKSISSAPQPQEPVIVKPGRTTRIPNQTPAGAPAGEKPTGTGTQAGGTAPQPLQPAGLGATSPESGSVVAPASGNPVSSGFQLTYPLGSQLRLTKPSETSIDEILRPGRYKTRTDVDFSKYLRTDLRGTGGPGGTGKPGRGGQAKGASVALNVATYNLTPWADDVLNNIQRNWTIDPAADANYRGEVSVAVMIKKNGELLAVEISSTSKIDVLDQAALRALNRSGPFPPLPDDFPNSSLEMVFVFQYGY